MWSHYAEPIQKVVIVCVMLCWVYIMCSAAYELDRNLGRILTAALHICGVIAWYVVNVVRKKKQRDELLVVLLINILDSHGLLKDDIRDKFNIKQM